jgi:hypothetical protein
VSYSLDFKNISYKFGVYFARKCIEINTLPPEISIVLMKISGFYYVAQE